MNPNSNKILSSVVDSSLGDMSVVTGTAITADRNFDSHGLGIKLRRLAREQTRPQQSIDLASENPCFGPPKQFLFLGWVLPLESV